jgi:hypothetical protein
LDDFEKSKKKNFWPVMPDAELLINNASAAKKSVVFLNQINVTEI